MRKLKLCRQRVKEKDAGIAAKEDYDEGRSMESEGWRKWMRVCDLNQRLVVD